MTHAAENMVAVLRQHQDNPMSLISHLGEMVSGMSELVNRVVVLESEVFNLKHRSPIPHLAEPYSIAGPNIGSKVPEGGQA